MSQLHALLTDAAHTAATGRNATPEPTHAQKLAGNYRMGRFRLHGMDLVIENPEGSFRTGTDTDGQPWRTRLAAHYGYFAGTRGADGDPVDVFIGVVPESPHVWVVNQVNPDGSFDEHKVMLGFGTDDLARAGYLGSYSPGWQGLGGMVRITLAQLRWWLKSGDRTAPIRAAADLLSAPETRKESNMKPVQWDNTAQPVGQTIGRVLYDIRLDDVGDDLLTDPMTMDEALSDPDIECLLVLDALVVEAGMLKPKTDQILTVLKAAGKAVQPQQVEIGEPVRLKGTMQIPVIYGMSDGQTLTIWFHNPDTTPAKLAPMDVLVSARWVINKKDVTIAVAPEKGKDLSPRDVARRIMALIEKNSAAFLRVNAKAGERAAQIEGLQGEIAGLEQTLDGLKVQIERAQEVKASAAAKAPKTRASSVAQPKLKAIDPQYVDNEADLAKLGKVTITDLGSENVYFTDASGTAYYTKLLEPDDWKLGEADFSSLVSDPAAAPPAPSPAPSPAAPLITVASKTRVRDDGGFPLTEVTLSNGSVHRLQRMDSAGTMGLPGWHIVSDPETGKGWERIKPTYMGDTEAQAIESLVERENRRAAQEPVAPAPAPVVLPVDVPATTPEQILTRRRDSLAKIVASGKENNGGVLLSLRPKALQARREELAKVEMELKAVAADADRIERNRAMLKMAREDLAKQVPGSAGYMRLFRSVHEMEALLRELGASESGIAPEPAPAPAAPPAPAEDPQIPPGIKARTEMLIDLLREKKDMLADVERARGNGHILSLEWDRVKIGVEEKIATLNKLRATAASKGLGERMDDMITAYGGMPDFSMYRTPDEVRAAEDSAQASAAPVPAPEPAAPAADLNGEPMQDAAPLFRSVSPEEWSAILSSGVIKGGLNTFNPFDKRREVFFALAPTAGVIDQGNEKMRRAEYAVQQGPLQVELSKLSARHHELDRTIEARAVELGARSYDDLDSYLKRKDSVIAPIRDEWSALSGKIADLQTKARAEINAKLAELATQDKARGYTSVLLETRPIAGGRVYTGKFSGMGAESEIGMDSGTVALGDVVRVTFYNGTEKVRESTPAAEDAGKAPAAAPAPASVKPAKKAFTYAVKPVTGGFVIESDDGGGIVMAGRPNGPGILNTVPPRKFSSEDQARDFMRKKGMTEAAAAAPVPAAPLASDPAPEPPAADLFGDTQPEALTPEGAESKVKTAKGTEVLTGYSVIEAARLITSHDPSTGDANPAFPPELQPRDRGRDASIAWVRKTANDLDPDLLGKSRRADSGAPIIGRDGVVESGNGRTMAVVLAYKTGKADDYRAWLEDEAAYFGLKPEKVKAMRHPVLVRIRTSKVDRAAFAIEANQSDTLAMTATEKAKSDARRMDDGMIALMTENGDLAASENVPFLSAFLRTLGEAEAAQYSTSDGKPTSTLIARVQAAIFAKAYADDRLLELTADVAKPEIANIVKALNHAAPEFIQAAAMDPEATSAATGKLTDAVEKSLNQKAVDALLGASNVIRQAKDAGQSVEEFVGQSGLFGDIDPDVAAMAVFIAKNNRSAKRMGEAFKAMATFIKGELQRRQTTDMFGDGEPVDFKDIVAAANRELERMYGAGVETIGLFDRPADPAPAGPAPAGAIAAAPDPYSDWLDQVIAAVAKDRDISADEARSVVTAGPNAAKTDADMRRSFEAMYAPGAAAYAHFGADPTKGLKRTPQEPDPEPDFDPVAAVNAAYTFDKATDDFKAMLADSLDQADYSEFATAKGLDQAVKAAGGTVSWSLVVGAILDSVAEISDGWEMDDPSEYEGVFDSVGEGEPQGVIRKGARILGRAVFGGDGKAMIYVGKAGADRVTINGQRAMWGEEPQALVSALFVMAGEVVMVEKTDPLKKYRAVELLPMIGKKQDLISRMEGDLERAGGDSSKAAGLIKAISGHKRDLKKYRARLDELSATPTSAPAETEPKGKKVTKKQATEAADKLEFTVESFDGMTARELVNNADANRRRLADAVSAVEALKDGWPAGTAYPQGFIDMAAIWVRKIAEAEAMGDELTIGAGDAKTMAMHAGVPESKWPDILANPQSTRTSGGIVIPRFRMGDVKAAISRAMAPAVSDQSRTAALAVANEVISKFPNGLSQPGVAQVKSAILKTLFSDPAVDAARGDEVSAFADEVYRDATAGIAITKSAPGLTPAKPMRAIGSPAYSGGRNAAQAPAAHDPDVEFLRSVIDKTAPDMLDPALADKIEAVMTRRAGDTQIDDLAGKAIDAYMAVAMDATAGIR